MGDYPFPQDFINKLMLLYGHDRTSSILQSFAVKKPITIRINTLKTTTEEVIKELDQNSIKFLPVIWYKNALILENISSQNVTDLDIYKEGKIYIQSLSSMLPVVVLQPGQNEKILDMTAAPGSKTTQMAAIMKNNGEIVANDISYSRIYKLKSNLAALGIINTKVISSAGQSLWQRYPEYFDRVLVDAPCSMEGRFNTFEATSYNHWSLKKVKNLAKLQKWLLRSAVSAVKKGGTVVYSTCTLSPEENEEVIDWILEKEKGKIKLEDIDIPALSFFPGLSTWEKTIFNDDMTKTKRIIPSEIMEGFYIAKIRKIDSNIKGII